MAKFVSLLFAAVGTIDAIYLLVAHYYVSVIPSRFKSAYLAVHGQGRSEFLGVPIAAIGVFGYIAIAVLLLNEKSFGGRGLALAFAFSTIGFLSSIRLVWVSITKADQLCPFCVLSAVCMTLIFIATGYR